MRLVLGSKKQKTTWTDCVVDYVRREPVIWFEGTLMREPRSVGGGEGLTWLLETLPTVKGPMGKITIHARGEDHTANIRRNLNVTVIGGSGSGKTPHTRHHQHPQGQHGLCLRRNLRHDA